MGETPLGLTSVETDEAMARTRAEKGMQEASALSSGPPGYHCPCPQARSEASTTPCRLVSAPAPRA